jgi:cobalt/nickel transport system permease protein
VLFVLAVVLTPPTAAVAFAAYALMLYAVARAARVPLSYALPRLVIEAPFVAFALFLPLVGGGDRLLLGLSVEGLWAMWNVLVKATLAAFTTILLGATTEIADVIKGLERLRAPRVITAIAGFMVRYADLVTGEMQRMKVARASRAYDPRWLWQARAVASSAATLFIRSYERGERVYLAMLSRGYAGSLPTEGTEGAAPRQWALALTLPVAAGVVAALAGTLPT